MNFFSLVEISDHLDTARREIKAAEIKVAQLIRNHIDQTQKTHGERVEARQKK